MKIVLCVVLAAVAPLAAETKVIRVKHRSAEELRRVVAIPNFGIDFSREFNTITLNGSAENIKIAEAVIEQYDVPRRQAEFLVRVIEASSAAQGANDAADLVPAELKSLLRYTRYAQRDSAVVRGMEAENLSIALGGDLGGKLRFSVRDNLLELSVGITGPPTNIKNNTGNETTQWPSLLNTVTTVKSGETVVLGASKMRGGTVALIVLLTAKLLP